MNYKMILQYEGTRYNGWQRQGNTDQTIQGKLETLLGRLTGEEVEVQGSGRTDAGVHARGQVANFHLKIPRQPEQLMEELNRYLPADIRRSGAYAGSGTVSQPAECQRETLPLSDLDGGKGGCIFAPFFLSSGK